MNQSKPSLMTCVAALTFWLVALTTPASSQEFTPIVGSYSCARFSNGTQVLVFQNGSGYSVARSTEIKKSVVKQRRLFNQRKRVLTEALRDFRARRLAKVRLIGTLNNSVIKLFGENGIPPTVLPDEAELAVVRTVERTQQELARLATLTRLINDCEGGVNLKKSSGSFLAPRVEVVVAVTRNSIQGGYAVVLDPQRVQFSSIPGGFNGCLKIFEGDGAIRKFYTGFGRDSNRCFAGNFDEVTPAQCEALIPEGKVGYVIQISQYNFLTLPGKTTEQLVDQMRLEVFDRLPTVAVLAFLKNISRDESIRLCDRF